MSTWRSAFVVEILKFKLKRCLLHVFEIKQKLILMALSKHSAFDAFIALILPSPSMSGHRAAFIFQLVVLSCKLYRGVREIASYPQYEKLIEHINNKTQNIQTIKIEAVDA